MARAVAERVTFSEATRTSAEARMLAVYMDHHVPAAITDGLRSRGICQLIAPDEVANQIYHLPL